MDAQTTTLLNNVQSLLSQLLQYEKGENETSMAPEAEAPKDEAAMGLEGNEEVEGGDEGLFDDDDEKMEKAADSDNNEALIPQDLEGDEEKKMEAKKALIAKHRMAIKALEETASDGVTANDGAEEKLDDNIPASEEAVEEVAKAIAKLISGKRTVNKTVKKSVNGEIFKVVKILSERQGTIEKALGGILEGLGVADEIKKATSIAKSEKNRRVNNPQDQADTLAYIQKALGVAPATMNGNGDRLSQNEQVRKSLTNSSLLKHLIVK